MIKYITKSDIKKGLQCLKHAYLSRYKKEDATPVDPYQQLLVERGLKVGQIAQEQISQHYHSKLLFEHSDSFEDGLMKTKLAFKDKRIKAFFEPTILADNLIVRCDALVENKKKYDLIEVKSGSDLDEEYILDAAIQYYVLEKAGIKINKTYVWYINKETPLPDLTTLFVKVDVSKEIKEYFERIEKTILALEDVFSKPKKVPKVTIGDFCSKPFDCPFKDRCFKKENKIPDLSVFNIPRIGQRAWNFFDDGLIDINDINVDTMKFTEAQKRMIVATQNNQMFLDKKEITKQLANFVFPLYLIDFEAMDYDLPGFHGTKPGIHIAFQLSVKVLNSPDGEIEDVAHYLHTDASDPRKAMGEFILNSIGDTGSIVAYSQAYEKGKILDIAKVFGYQEALRLEELTTRLVDPLPIFRSAVYHPEFKGSYSIKKVGPALIGKEASYEKLEVQDGTQAVVAFRKMITSQNSEEKQNLINALTKYCDKDVYVMGQLVKWLFAHKD